MHEARLVSFSFRISFPLLLGVRGPLSVPRPLRARHYGHPESTDTAEYKAKGEAERESQKRGNRRQVIPRRKLVSIVRARTFASQGKRRPLRKGVCENGTVLSGPSLMQGGCNLRRVLCARAVMSRNWSYMCTHRHHNYYNDLSSRRIKISFY